MIMNVKILLEDKFKLLQYKSHPNNQHKFNRLFQLHPAQTQRQEGPQPPRPHREEEEEAHPHREEEEVHPQPPSSTHKAPAGH